jgi:hypothetical protein
VRQPVTSYASVIPFFYYNLPPWNSELRIFASRTRQLPGQVDAEPTGVKEEAKMSNQNQSEDSSRRNFLSAAAVVASAAVAAPTVANAQTSTKKPRGIYADSGLTDKVADFSYQSDALAEMIVRAWTDATYLANIKTPSGAQAELTARGFSLQNPIVIEESTYVAGYHAATPNAVVFVIPDPGRITTGRPLLETAKLLMAVTPNGI